MSVRIGFLLDSLQTYITQEFVGFLFGVDKGTVSRKVQELSLCMTGVFRIPENKVRIDPGDLEAIAPREANGAVTRGRRSVTR